MLAREAFQEMLFPLSEKELHYREHPEDSLIYFKNFRYEGEATVVTGADNSDEILFFPSPKKQAASNLHGVISPKIAPRVLEGGNLAFNKQTRFGMVPLHRHNYIEMNYVYSGTCVQEINGQTVEMHTGDVIILDRDVVHRVLPTGENDILLNCLMGQNYFKASFTERLAASGAVPRFLSNALNERNDHDHYLLFHTERSYIFRDLFECVFCEYLDPTTCTAGAVENYMSLIFIELARCYQGNQEHEYHKSNKNYLTEVLQYMDDHCIDCTLESTAAHFGFHPNYLSRMVKEGTGSAFKDLVSDGRLSRAAFLLLTTEAPISQIANQCGYSNQNFFYKKFQVRYGCTPAVYRATGGALAEDIR